MENKNHLQEMVFPSTTWVPGPQPWSSSLIKEAISSQSSIGPLIIFSKDLLFLFMIFFFVEGKYLNFDSFLTLYIVYMLCETCTEGQAVLKCQDSSAFPLLYSLISFLDFMVIWNLRATIIYPSYFSDLYFMTCFEKENIHGIINIMFLR